MILVEIISSSICRNLNRFGATKDDINNDQRSPVFIQFLDALYQIVAEYAVHFEYTVDLLSLIAHHVTSCRFGSFLADCEFERVRTFKLHQNTGPFVEGLGVFDAASTSLKNVC